MARCPDPLLEAGRNGKNDRSLTVFRAAYEDGSSSRESHIRIENRYAFPFEPDMQFNQFPIFPNERDLHRPSRMDKEFNRSITLEVQVYLPQEAIRSKTEKSSQIFMEVSQDGVDVRSGIRGLDHPDPDLYERKGRRGREE